MFKLFSPKSDHPLADPKEFKRVVEEIGAADHKKAVAEVADWLESLLSADDIGLEQRWSILTQLDDIAHRHLRATTKELLQALAQRTASDRLWLLGVGLWQRLAAAYAACLEGVESAPLNTLKDFRKNQLPILCIRHIHAHGQWLKWSQFRYGPIEGATWQGMARAYLVAARAGLDRRHYPGLPGGGDSTARDEYLKAVLFHASALDHLKPVDAELVERLVGRYCSLASLTDTAQEDSLYWIDPQQPSPPVRLAQPPRQSPTLRFFGAGQLIPQLRDLAEALRRGDVPADLNLGGQYPSKVLLPVVEHLLLYWAPSAPTRQHPRHPVRSSARVVVGFEGIHELLAGLRSAAATWEIENVSRGGLGLRATQRDEALFRLGALVAVQPDGGGNWLLGVVRRLVREPDGVIRIGVKTLTASPGAVRVQLGGETVTGLLLDSLEQGASVRLALPQYDYEDRLAITLTHQNAFAELQPVGLLDSAEGCDLARYRVSQLMAAG